MKKFCIMLVCIGTLLSILLTVVEVSAQDTSRKGIELPGIPFDVDVDTNTNVMYFAMGSNKSAVSVINGSTNEIIGNLFTGQVRYSEYLGVDPSMKKLYLANMDGGFEGNDSISVIDISYPYEPILNISLRGEVKGIDVNPNTSMIYVSTSWKSNPDDVGEVAVINGSNNNITTHVPLKLNSSLVTTDDFLSNPGLDAIKIVQNTNRIYVPIDGSNAVAVIDGNTNHEMPPIIVAKSSWFDIDVNNMNNSLNLINDDANRVYIMDSNTNNIKKTIINNISGETQDPISLERLADSPISRIAVNPYTNIIYASRISDLSANDSSKIYIIDGNVGRMIDSLDVNIKPMDLTFNPITNMTYVLGKDGNKVSVIDGNTNDLILGKDIVVNKSNIASTSIGLKIGFDPFKVVANPATNTMYVLYNRSKDISLINGDNDSVTNTNYYDDFPTDLAANAERNLIYITYPSLDLVAVVDGRTNKVIENITDIKKPLSVTVSPVYNEIYLTNQSKSIFIVDGYTNKYLSTIDVGVIPYDVSIDENLNKVFVSYASM